MVDFLLFFYGSVELNLLNGSTPGRWRDDDRFSATFGANPTEVMRLYVFYYNPSTSSVTFSVNVTFWYECEVYDPIIVAQSLTDFMDRVLVIKDKEEKEKEEKRDADENDFEKSDEKALRDVMATYRRKDGTIYVMPNDYPKKYPDGKSIWMLIDSKGKSSEMSYEDYCAYNLRQREYEKTLKPVVWNGVEK